MKKKHKDRWFELEIKIEPLKSIQELELKFPEAKESPIKLGELKDWRQMKSLYEVV